MADTKISALSNAAALGGTEQLPGVQAAGNVNITPTQIKTFVHSTYGTGVATWLATPSSANFAAAVTGETGTGGVVFDTSPTFTTSITITGGTLTASTPSSLTQTWNNGAVVFKALTIAITDTASDGMSAFMDCTVGGTSHFHVRKDGHVTVDGAFNWGTVGGNIYAAMAFNSGINGFCVASDRAFQWSSSSTQVYSGVDTDLRRVAAGIVKVTNNSTGAGVIVTQAVAVASLPSAATAGAGARAFVTDAATTLLLGLGTTVAGSGANKVPVYSDGTNWIYG